MHTKVGLGSRFVVISLDKNIIQLSL